MDPTLRTVFFSYCPNYHLCWNKEAFQTKWNYNWTKDPKHKRNPSSWIWNRIPASHLMTVGIGSSPPHNADQEQTAVKRCWMDELKPNLEKSENIWNSDCSPSKSLHYYFLITSVWSQPDFNKVKLGWLFCDYSLTLSWVKETLAGKHSCNFFKILFISLFGLLEYFCPFFTISPFH